MLENFIAIITLVFMEGLLSFDNALALAALVKPLPEEQQKKALMYGMVCAFLFRFIALFCVTFIMANPFIKVLGGLYLLFIGIQGIVGESDNKSEMKLKAHSFIRILILVELCDLAFSVDSILAAVAFSNVMWVVVTGGILGIIMMRFASSMFISLMKTFPNLEKTAFILVTVVGLKIFSEVCWDLDFHSHSSLYFYLFWVATLASLVYGFSKKVGANEISS